jgi:hypothetical protein
MMLILNVLKHPPLDAATFYFFLPEGEVARTSVCLIGQRGKEDCTVTATERHAPMQSKAPCPSL